MNVRYLWWALPLGLVACSSSSPPPAAPEPAAPEPPPASAEAEPSAPEAAPEPSEEELKQRAAAEQLANDRARFRAEAEQELARWTPELREQARALAERNYYDTKVGLTAILQSPHRKPDHAARDAHRHPIETLQFFGLRPNSRVLEHGPGEGWYTELLAPLLAARGKLVVTTADPQGPADSRATLYAERLDLMLQKSPELFGRVERAVYDPGSPELALDPPVDLALVIRGMHGWVRDDSLSVWLTQLHRAIKPGGSLGIVQHRAAPGADPKQSAPSGYLPEAWVIEQVEAHGFRLAQKSELNANPRDTRDHEGGVWALPPTLRHGERDREKYVSIGESDRMTLRFTRSAK